MSPKARIFLHSILLYGLTAAIALVSAWQHVVRPSAGFVSPLELTLQNGLIFLGVFVVFTFLMVRFVRVAHVSLSFFLALALIAGGQFVLSPWAPGLWSVAGAVALALLLRRIPLVITHDAAVMLGIGGISALLGLSVNPLFASSLLAVLAVYDIISVYRTQHMVTLAGRMLENGAVFGFLVPASISGFFARREDALRTRSVMMLGSGDIGLPLVLATSAISQSIGAAVLVVAFSLVGVSLMHWLFSHQDRPAPMAALPPIAVASILGYVTAILLGI